jgi:hypothetical protein
MVILVAAASRPKASLKGQTSPTGYADHPVGARQTAQLSASGTSLPTGHPMAPHLTTVTLRELPRAPNPARFMATEQVQKEQAASHEPERGLAVRSDKPSALAIAADCKSALHASRFIAR